MNTSTIKILMAYLIVCLIAFVSCETEPDPGNRNNNGNNGTGNNAADEFAADELSEFLVLEDAAKITGDPKEAPDFQLKINFKDTIFVMKGSHLGARVAVRHDGLHDITGFYIAVDNGSFYYDVPVAEDEAQDSTDIVYINIEVPEKTDIDYPLTIPIRIQPHGPDGEPLDEFDKEVTIEDPEAGVDCSITHPFTGSNEHPDNWWWYWDYTLGFNYDGELFHFEAPGLKQVSSYQTGGCCSEDGTSSTVADDSYCFEKFSDGSPNPVWRSIDVAHYFVWNYDVLWFYDNGTFGHENVSSQTNYRPSKSDFCNNKAAYDEDIGFFLKKGTHDFTSGTDYLTVSYDVTNPPVYGRTLLSGQIEYTCHILVFIYEIEGQKWEIVFRKYAVEGTLFTLNIIWD